MMTSAKAPLLFSLLLIGCVASPALSQVTPNPVLVFFGQIPFEQGGKPRVRYNYFVFNAESFRADMFAPSPDLPPCGTNTRASRTWVDFFDQRGKRLQGFCALTGPDKLNMIWFALDAGELPPSWIYIEMNDRKTSTKYKSNLAETVL